MSERYLRQLNIQEIGAEGQSRLASSSILIVGAGGLGSALLYCLAGAGVGRIGISEFDTVSEHNLNRQFLYKTEDIGKDKLSAAISALKGFNPEVSYEALPRITEENALSVTEGFDLVVAAVDNLEARLILNKACCEKGIILVNGSVEGMNGLVNTVYPGKSACLECIYGASRGYAATPTSFAPVVTAVSALMAQVSLLLLLGKEDPIKGELLHFDGTEMCFDRIPVIRNPECKVCSLK